jgi:AraC-like DNA-binding protein
LSESGLRRRFHDEVGQSLADFVTQQRIERAKQLLRETNRPVTDIAFSLGFNSSLISRRFSSVMSASPRPSFVSNARKARADHPSAPADLPRFSLPICPARLAGFAGKPPEEPRSASKFARDVVWVQAGERVDTVNHSLQR